MNQDLVGTRTTTPTPTLDDLQRRLLGPMLCPGDEGYADDLAGFDLAVSQHPAIVVGATGAADVVVAERYARDAGLAVGVQATGHGITVPADDALPITTRRADAVRVDPADGTAWVEAGAVWSRVLPEAASGWEVDGHGAVPRTTCSSSAPRQARPGRLRPA